MKGILNLAGWTITILFFAGCAATYRPPQTQATAVSVTVPGSKAKVFRKVVSALLAEGYSIASSDEGVGVISTQRRQMSLTPADVDVGSTMGIDYMKDKRTTTYVTLTIQVSDGRAVIRSDIDAEYLPNNPTYGKRMKGVSRGTLEQRIAARLQN